MQALESATNLATGKESLPMDPKIVALVNGPLTTLLSWALQNSSETVLLENATSNVTAGDVLRLVELACLGIGTEELLTETRPESLQIMHASFRVLVVETQNSLRKSNIRLN